MRVQLDSNSSEDIEAFLAARHIDPIVRTVLPNRSDGFRASDCRDPGGEEKGNPGEGISL